MPEFAATVQSHGTEWLNELCASLERLSAVDAALAVDVNSYLPYDLLVKVDITTMASGLEARSPFLDHEVMEFVARLPENCKLRGGRAKYLARETFKGLLVKEAVERKKMGFTVPVAKWLRGELRRLLEDALLSSRAQARGYLRPEKMRELVHQHLIGHRDHSALLWALLMLEMWHWEFIDAAPSTALYTAAAVRTGAARVSS
jgi:asparagine synthase (glutamine-hydrolysing)